MPREFLRDRLFVRLWKFEYIRISFKVLKRKLNFLWQPLLLFGLLILHRVKCRSERQSCAKDEKIIIIRIGSSLVWYCDETYKFLSQPGNNSFKKWVFKAFCLLYRVAGHLGGRLVGRYLFVADRFASPILAANS